MKLLRPLILALVLTAGVAAQAGEKGQVGLSVKAEADGAFFGSATLKSLTVAAVTPGSPAAAAGLLPGDQLLAVNGKAVAGAHPEDLQPGLQLEVGQTVKLTVRSAGGQTREVVLVAAAKPAATRP